MDLVTVTIALGMLRGQRMTTKNGVAYWSFKNIPFAKPPTGPLRFKPPEDPEPWSGIRDALEDVTPCSQYQSGKGYIGSEDCLYLNVYSTKLPDDESGMAPFPVIVAIHGGAFAHGSASSNFTGPDFLLDEGDVVVVAMNYRLGVFGFLSVEHPACPGNMGLKDQVAALRWVQKNIAKFGGDPHNVTLLGYSSGGASVSYHMLSPMSKGLFHRAIAMSGTAVNTRSLNCNPREAAICLAEALGYSGRDPQELVDFLRTKDHIEIVKAFRKKLIFPVERILRLPFIPSLEVEVNGIERFLPGHPETLVEEGRFHAVPYVTGTTSHEGIFMACVGRLITSEALQKIDENFTVLIPRELRVQPKAFKKPEEVGSQIKNFYFKGRPVSEETLPDFINMMTDIYFAEGTHTFINKMVRHGKAPVYQYSYAFEGGSVLKPRVVLKYKGSGATHVEDENLIYWRDFVNEDEIQPGSPIAITRARLVKMWTNFAKTGNLTPDKDALLKVKWEPYTHEDRYYLLIANDLELKSDLFKERMQFWNNLHQNMNK